MRGLYSSIKHMNYLCINLTKYVWYFYYKHTKKVIKHIKKELQNTDEENQRSKKNGEMVIWYSWIRC